MASIIAMGGLMSTLKPATWRYPNTCVAHHTEYHAEIESGALSSMLAQSWRLSLISHMSPMKGVMADYVPISRALFVMVFQFFILEIWKRRSFGQKKRASRIGGL